MDPKSENSLITHAPFKVSSADVDMYSRLRPSALLNFFIQSARQSAEEFGFGYEGLQARQLFWVLRLMHIEILNTAKWDERLTVETWPKDVERLLYLRDFLVRNQNERIIARATSGWLAIDIESRRPKTIEGLEGSVFVRLRNKHALTELPRKLSGIKDGSSHEIHTAYSDIDLNKHVTATRYLDWMMDTFPPEKHKHAYPAAITLNYLKETMPGEVIELKWNGTEDEEDEYAFEGMNQSNGNAAFRGLIRFRQPGKQEDG